jgi:hypothetical protein
VIIRISDSLQGEFSELMGTEGGLFLRFVDSGTDLWITKSDAWKLAEAIQEEWGTQAVSGEEVE